MDNEKIGQFICELRKENKLTQKDLAEKVGITDKAVSKWERGLSYPDIALLPDIANALHVTTSELLEGERDTADKSGTLDTEIKINDEVNKAVKKVINYAGKTVKKRENILHKVFTLTYSLAAFVGILSTMIVDYAINGDFTWSKIAIVSILYGYIVAVPVIRFGKKGVIPTLLAATVLTVPLLYMLDEYIDETDMIFTIGWRMSIIGIILMWIVYGCFRFIKRSRFIAGGVAFLCTIPVQLIVNYVLHGLIDESIIDVWDIFSMIMVAIVAGVLIAIGIRRTKE